LVGDSPPSTTIIRTEKPPEPSETTVLPSYAFINDQVSKILEEKALAMFNSEIQNFTKQMHSFLEKAVADSIRTSWVERADELLAKFTKQSSASVANKADMGRVEQVESKVQALGVAMQQKVDLAELKAVTERYNSRLDAVSSGKADNTRLEALSTQLQATGDSILARRNEVGSQIDAMGVQQRADSTKVEILNCKVERASEQLQNLSASFEESIRSLNEALKQKSEQLGQRKADTSMLSVLEDNVRSRLELLDRKFDDMSQDSVLSRRAELSRVEQLERSVEQVIAKTQASSHSVENLEIKLGSKIQQVDGSVDKLQATLVQLNDVMRGKVDATGMEKLELRITSWMAQLDSNVGSNIERLGTDVRGRIDHLESKYSPALLTTSSDLGARTGHLESFSKSIMQELVELRGKASQQQIDDIKKELKILGEALGDYITRKVKIVDTPEPVRRVGGGFAPSRSPSPEKTAVRSPSMPDTSLSILGTPRSLSESRLREAQRRAQRIGHGHGIPISGR